MRMFLLAADEDTVTGMRLAGTEGIVVRSADDFSALAQRISEDKDIGILLIAHTLSERFPQEIFALKKRSDILVTQIPDMLDPAHSGDNIKDYIREKVGMTV